MVTNTGQTPANLRCFEETGRVTIEVTGKDRQKYLNAMLTNQVVTLEPGQGCLACAVLVSTDADCAEAALVHLRKFIVINQVTLSLLDPQPRTFALEGPGAEAALAELLGEEPIELEPMSHTTRTLLSAGGGEVTIVRFSCTSEIGYRIVTPSGQSEAVWRAVEATVTSRGGCALEATEVEAHRVAFGWPRWGAELSETILPPLAGLALRAISYTKGCYLGQEPLAMLKFRGQMNKRLMRLQVAGDAPIAPATPLVDAEGASCGEVTSAAPGAALGYVKRSAFSPGTRVHVGSPEGPEAVVQPLGFPAYEDPA
ncbi:MAG: CAF17-like 4Fe-4S cluster assembly/insertion protein YgfZ [Planctomycetota bacterium]